MSKETLWACLRYSVAYALSFLVCWASFAKMMATGGNYISILSYQLFVLQEYCRYWFGGPRTTITSPATIMPVLLVSIVFTVDAWLVYSPKLRATGIVLAVFLGLATFIWIPNPWVGM